MSSQPIRHSGALLIAWRLAELEAANLRSDELEPVHFFLALLKLGELDVKAILRESTSLSDGQICGDAGSAGQLAACFSEVGLETTQTRRRLRRSLPRASGSAKAGQHLRRNERSKQAFATADDLAAQFAGGAVEPLHLLAGVIGVDCPWVSETLVRCGVNEADLTKEVMVRIHAAAVSGDCGKVVERGPQGVPDKDLGGRAPRPGFSERMGRDLTALARLKKLSPVIGRKEEMRALIQTLLRSRKNNAILIGEAGVGKTVIVEGLAQRIADGAVPPEFIGKRIVEISMGSLVAGTNLRGELEERLQALIAESKRDPNLILFIDEIHLIAGAGRSSGSAMDAANLLKPALANGDIRVIGATTTQEFRRFLEVDAALTRRFQVIEVAEPDRAESVAILLGLRPGMEDHHGIKIEDEAVDAAVDLSQRYITDHHLPDKAIDVLDQACAQARMRSLTGDFMAQFKAGLSITRKDVAAAVAQRCKIPVGDMDIGDSARLLGLESELEKQVKGQSGAIGVVSEAIRLARSGLKQAGKPIGVFLFTGPSGTGKTELAKALAACLYGSADHLIRLDMSEFMEAHSVSKLIGAPPGFVGHEERGQLTEKVRSQPCSVVLLDEVEKAHPKILDLFLQVFDSACLTDSHGTKCDFRETIIIMTSNLGGNNASPPIGFGAKYQQSDSKEELEAAAHTAAKRFFRPEFLNRLTEIVVFQPLGMENIRQIVVMLVARLNERLKDRVLTIELTPDALDYVITKGYSSTAGARELERAVEREISTPLWNLILKSGPDSTARTFCVGHKSGDEILTIG